MKTIEVIVQKDGTLKIDAVGFSGPDCEKEDKKHERPRKY